MALLDEQICFLSTARVLGGQACALFKSILQPSTLVREPKALSIETAVLLQRFMEELIQAAIFVGPLVTFVLQVLLSHTTLFWELLFLVSPMALSVGCGLNVLLTMLARLSRNSMEKRKTNICHTPWSVDSNLWRAECYYAAVYTSCAKSTHSNACQQNTSHHLSLQAKSRPQTHASVQVCPGLGMIVHTACCPFFFLLTNV